MPSDREKGSTPAMAALVVLQECGLALKDRECLLQAIDFGLAARLPLLVRFGLCNAALP